MTFLPRKTLLCVAILSSVFATNVSADDNVLSERIDRLERIIQGQGLVSLLGRVDQLQSEVQNLHGENEALHHELDKMAKRQRELYLDLDQRIEAQKLQSTQDLPQPISEETPSSDMAANQNLSSDTTDVTTNNPNQTPMPSAPVAVESGEAAYQSALQILRSGQYEQAITALSTFPTEYPNSPYLPNAYYWQGEANYVLRNFKQAVAAFETVIQKYPASTKVADATLKLGFSQYELGQLDIAKSTLEKVMELYPTTSASRLAKVRLDRIKKQAQ